jgi:hypothetical protein
MRKALRLLSALALALVGVGVALAARSSNRVEQSSDDPQPEDRYEDQLDLDA